MAGRKAAAVPKNKEELLTHVTRLNLIGGTGERDRDRSCVENRDSSTEVNAISAVDVTSLSSKGTGKWSKFI